MQRGRKLAGALLVEIGLTEVTGFAPEATQVKSHIVTAQRTSARNDDHGRHGKDDRGRHGHGRDDGPNHH